VPDEPTAQPHGRALSLHRRLDDVDPTARSGGEDPACRKDQVLGELAGLVPAAFGRSRASTPALLAGRAQLRWTQRARDGTLSSSTTVSMYQPGGASPGAAGVVT
jgi:hypothetical protein